MNRTLLLKIHYADTGYMVHYTLSFNSTVENPNLFCICITTVILILIIIFAALCSIYDRK